MDKLDWIEVAGSLLLGSLVLGCVGLLVFAMYRESLCTFIEDRAKTQEYFEACLKLVPKGPQSTHYNDWAEVVEECGRQARARTLTRVCS